MRRLLIAAAMLFAGVWTAEAQTLDCGRAFTGMELAICGSSSLRLQYNKLNRTTEQAVSRAQLSPLASNEYRDKLARSCGSASDLEHCLEQEIAKALNQLSRSSSPVHGSTSLAQLQIAPRMHTGLRQADAEFQKSGDPEPLIVALLALLQHYQSHPESVTGEVEVNALRGRLLEGCNDLSKRRKWNRVLQTYGWSCPLNYASSEFD